MERQYQCRYERGATGLFPVTHRLSGPCGDMGAVAAWGLVSIGNFEVLNWKIIDSTGNVLVHGSEQNHGRTRVGYTRMIKRALQHMRGHGGVRVYPRQVEDRKPAARLHGRDGYTGAVW